MAWVVTDRVNTIIVRLWIYQRRKPTQIIDKFFKLYYNNKKGWRIFSWSKNVAIKKYPI